MSNINVKNKKAWHLYEIIETFVAGIELYGTEIKSIRQNKASLNEAYCMFHQEQLYVKMHIGEYSHGTSNNHEPRRERKLLLHRKELDRLFAKSQTKGLTIVPLKLFIGDNGYAKLEIALARGKKEWDKRHDLKDKDSKRELDQVKKNNL
jgi:SsrA-binding protein